jgi:hypothetical protein
VAERLGEARRGAAACRKEGRREEGKGLVEGGQRCGDGAEGAPGTPPSRSSALGNGWGRLCLPTDGARRCVQGRSWGGGGVRLPSCGTRWGRASGVGLSEATLSYCAAGAVWRQASRSAVRRGWGAPNALGGGTSRRRGDRCRRGLGGTRGSVAGWPWLACSSSVWQVWRSVWREESWGRG